MKRNMICGIVLIGALALGSCSTSKLASSQANKDDDVYYSNAKAGDEPVYVTQTNQEPAYRPADGDADYYYYDSYASRINRFDYFSPFGYYDDLYYGYNPYYLNGFYSPYYSGFGLGFGYGYGGYGYSPYFYGYNPYSYGYSPYSYWGIGYGGYPYWGVYSASRVTGGSPRPYRGSGAPANALVNRSTRPIGYNGSYPVNANYPGRPTVNNGRQAVNSTGRTSYNNGANTRPARTDNSRPVYQPQTQRSYTPPPPPPSSSGNSGSSGGGSNSGGGGGSRPARP